MKKYSMETMVGLFVLLGILGIAYMTIHFAEVDVLGNKDYPLMARFNTITGLKTGASVEMLGMKIGTVERFIMDQDKQQAVVELSIKQDIMVYDDAIASIKTRGLIGDQYISIDAGGGGDRLQPGDTIIDTESPIDIEALISKYAFGDAEEKK